MIDVAITLFSGGEIKSFQAKGHALAGSVGQDIVCAAATILLRTCARVLNSRANLEVRGDAVEPGEMTLQLESAPAEIRDWIRGVTDSLVRGLRDLHTEYPQRINVSVLTQKDELV